MPRTFKADEAFGKRNFDQSVKLSFFNTMNFFQSGSMPVGSQAA
jgi:hypothetical protein